MEIVGWILFGLGAIVMIVTGIMIMIKAFQTSLVWGLLYIFVPFASIVFCVMHWNKVGKLFLIALVSLLPFYGGIFMTGMSSGGF